MFLGLSFNSFGLPNYRKLVTKDYQEMRALLKTYIEKSRQEARLDDNDYKMAKAKLKQALSVVFMRPNDDGLQQSLLSVVQNEIIKYEHFLTLFEAMIDDSLLVLSQKSSSKVKSAHFIIVENSVDYLANNKQKASQEILTKIKKAKLKIPTSLKKYRQLSGNSKDTVNPSLLAGRILKKIKAQEKLKLKKKTTKKK